MDTLTSNYSRSFRAIQCCSLKVAGDSKMALSIVKDPEIGTREGNLYMYMVLSTSMEIETPKLYFFKCQT